MAWKVVSIWGPTTNDEGKNMFPSCGMVNNPFNIGTLGIYPVWLQFWNINPLKLPTWGQEPFLTWSP